MKVRQQAPTLARIRDDHVERYRWAALAAMKLDCTRATDVGAGVGYGSFILADMAGLRVTAYERDLGAVAYGREYYRHALVETVAGDVTRSEFQPGWDGAIATAFELIEHVDDPGRILRMLALTHRWLAGSVPNEEVVPFAPGVSNPEHRRHYRPGEIRQLLQESGWRVDWIGGQTGKRLADAKIVPEGRFRTLVFLAESEARK